MSGESLLAKQFQISTQNEFALLDRLDGEERSIMTNRRLQ